MPITLIAVYGGLIIGSFNETDKHYDIYSWLITIPIIGAALGYGFVRAINRQKTIFETYILILGDNLITREQLNSPPVSIYFEDIGEIIKNKNGNFTIKGKDRKGIIYVPAQIENYQNLKSSLSQIMPLKEKSGLFQQAYFIVITVLTIGLMMCVFTFTNKIVLGIAGTSLIGLLLWSFIAIRRNKSIDTETKSRSWWILVIIVIVTIEILQKIISG